MPVQGRLLIGPQVTNLPHSTDEFNCYLLSYQAGLVAHVEEFLGGFGDQLSAVLVHGDYGPNNVLLDPVGHQVTAIVDWEWAHAGDPVEDLAWCEWIVRMHHPEHIAAIDALFDAYGFRPAWSAGTAGCFYATC